MSAKRFFGLALVVLTAVCAILLIATSSKPDASARLALLPAADHYTYLPKVSRDITPTFTPTPSRTPTSTPSRTPTSTPSGTPTSTPSRTPTPTATSTSTSTTSSAIIIDHTAVAQFEHIPAAYIQAASKLRVFWRHASTGGYISQGLDCLQHKPDYNDSPLCTIYPVDYYNRDNWSDALWNPTCYEASCKTDQFYDVLVNQGVIANTDVAMMKFCYIDSIMLYDTQLTYNEFPHYQTTMDTLAASYPQKDLVWWTAPLLSGWSSWDRECSDLNHFNVDVRNYVNANDKFLFDLADIESYTESGTRCYQQNECPHMCSDYSPDGGGHPNQVGSVRIAKAFWVMMARLAGWDGKSTQ